MPLQIRRLNMDNTWQIHWQGTSIILDPWLVGSEVDGFSWFNEQWHTTPPVTIDALGRQDIVLVSQPYSDHCHAQTVRELSYTQLIAVRPAAKRLRKEIPAIGTIIELPDAQQGWHRQGGLELARLSPDRWIDPIYHAILIRHGDEVVFYAPHGFALTEPQLAAIATLRVKVLMTTFTYYELPAIIGGVVNPGMPAVKLLAAQLNPIHILNTHDEQKEGRGLVMKIAKVKYTDVIQARASDTRIIDVPDYAYLTFD
jgi:Beta-lactamase superfamily domain